MHITHYRKLLINHIQLMPNGAMVRTKVRGGGVKVQRGTDGSEERGGGVPVHLVAVGFVAELTLTLQGQIAWQHIYTSTTQHMTTSRHIISYHITTQLVQLQ